jgi:hypothetical protein
MLLGVWLLPRGWQATTYLQRFVWPRLWDQRDVCETAGNGK